MNHARTLFSDVELCAFLDGEIDAERRADMEASLARQPGASAKIETWRRQIHMMRASFGRIAQEPVPRQMTAAFLQQTGSGVIAAVPSPQAVLPPRAGEPALRAHEAPDGSRRVWRSVGLGIIGFFAITGVIASGMLQKINGSDPQGPVLASAAPGYRLTRHAVEAHAAFAPRAEKLMDFRSADSAVLTAAALQAGLDARLPGAVGGLRTLGLRLTPGETGLSGLLLFNSAQHGPVSLYMTRDARGGAPGLVLRESGRLTIASFLMEGTAYALTGAAPRDQMVDWASAMRQSLLQPKSLRGS